MVVQVTGESPEKHEKKVIFRRAVEGFSQAKKPRQGRGSLTRYLRSR
jgi:hypothetical protein